MSEVHGEQLVIKGVTMKSHSGLNARIWLQQLLCHGPSPTAELSCCANCCLLLMVHTAQPALSVPSTAKSTLCAELAPSGTVPVPALAVQSPATKGYTTGCFKVSGLIRQTDLANKTSITAFYFGCRWHS